MPIGEKTKLLWQNTEYRKKMSETHRGRLPWNKGKKGVQIPWNKGKIYTAILGENHFAWVGDKVKYGGIHEYFRRIYGKATKCENLNCLKKSKKFHRAKLRNKSYERKIENFIELCQSCHQKYDRDPNFGIIL